MVFKNHNIDVNGNTGQAMGTYDFTDATDGSKTTVEYTFGYKKCEDGKVRIYLHHSSVPYAAAKPPPAGIVLFLGGSLRGSFTSEDPTVSLVRFGTQPATFRSLVGNR